jgi:hypothetical protein
MHAYSAAAAISSRFHPQRMPLSSAPTAALQHIRAALVFAHAARASRPLRLPPQLLPSAARAFCTGQEVSYSIEGNSRRALHMRSHTTATGRACSGD